MAQIVGFPAGGTYFYVIYDETDEIAKPVRDRSSTWLAAHGGFSKPISPASRIEVTPLGGHFYLHEETT